MTKVIIPLKISTLREVAITLQQLDPRIDIIEFWLDSLLEDLQLNRNNLGEVRRLLSQTKQTYGVDFLAVCKGPNEQGTFAGNPMQKLQLLQKFIDLGGDYIDVDVTQTPLSLIETFQKNRLWLSFHDFTGLPENLDEHFTTMLQLDPCLYKFAITINTESDLKTFLQWCGDKKKSHPEKRFIFTTMGKYGVEGREKLESENLTWGGFWALNEELKTASGQRIL